MPKTALSAVEESCVIRASPAIVYTVLTSPADMAGWLANEARCEARPGGLYELRWQSGFIVQGKVLAAERPRLLSIAWRSAEEPRETLVTFGVAPVDAGAEVTVRHSGFPRGARGEAMRQESLKGWPRTMQNLRHLIETGIDLREAQRPLMGVNLGQPLDAELAASEGIDATSGVYLAGVIPGLSAQAAGLQARDVIVALDGRPVADFAGMVAELQGHAAGDIVLVNYVRGTEHRTVALELKPKPIADIPTDPKVLLATLLEDCEKARTNLVIAVTGASEEQAEKAPAEGEWSAKQTIAHLCVNERDLHHWIGEMIMGNEPPHTPGDPSALPERLAAVLAGAPTIAGLLNRLVQDQADTLALVAAIRPEIVANKPRYRRIGQTVAEVAEHINDHVLQVKAALAAAR